MLCELPDSYAGCPFLQRPCVEDGRTDGAANSVAACKAGNVVGGVRAMNALSPDLNAPYDEEFGDDSASAKAWTGIAACSWPRDDGEAPVPGEPPRRSESGSGSGAVMRSCTGGAAAV